MPMYEMGLPVSSSNLKITHNGVDYSLVLGTETFVRVGKDGDESTLPLCGGDEYVGESLEGQWKKGFGADITPFTARINDGVLELGGKYDGAGADPDGWINSHHPIPLMNELEVTVELESPTNDTAEGASGNIKTEFYIRQDKAVNSPDDDDNYLKISIDVTAAGLLMEVIEEIGGTPNTIFNGSTHDDAVGRSLTAEKFTVWRIVFHDGVAGADSPEDVRHIHIHLKQGVDRATAEDATENQLTTSPYAIDDYLFNVGYPAYRIYTTDTTFFGSAVASGDEAMSTYLRIIYPALFSLKYDFTDADYGKGDVELWDGDPDVATSVQVFDEDHVFTNDPYLQNGLMRLQVDYKPNPVEFGLKLFGYYGASWNQPFDQLWFHAVTSNEDLSWPMLRYIEQISPEKTAIVVRLLDSDTVNDDYYIDVRITLERGKYTIKIDSLDVFPDQDVRFWFLESTTVRFGYVQEGAVGDDDVDDDGINTTPIDNFMIALDDAGEAVIGVVSTDEKPAGGNTRFFAEDGGDLSIEDIDAVDTAGTIIWVSLIPFALIANLFIEAEAGNYTGTTPGNDANASGAGNNYVLLDLTGDFQTLAGEYSTYQFDAGDDLPEGRYLAVIRARYETEETMRMYVWNDNDDVYRNEENAKVTKTLAATFGYHFVVFDITAADVTGTDTFAIVAEKATADTDEIRIDYFVIFPIGDGADWPQDLAHGTLRTFTKPRRLYVR